MVPVYALLLFGGALLVDAGEGVISVDRRADFKAPAKVGALIKGLRAELDAVLAAKVRDPSLELSDCRAASICMQLLELDGF